MALGDTPAVARRTVRLAIRDARLAKGLTQTQVADAMEWSLSKVMRIESGEVTISPNDLRPLLNHLGIRDKAKADELVQAAKASKQRRQWWDHPRYAGMFTPAMKQWFSYEVEATLMRIFCAAYLPGFMQTAEFARYIVGFYEDDLSAEEINARVETRTLRQQALAQRKTHPRAEILLDQSALMRTLHQPKALAHQLSSLLDAVDEGWATVRIVPFAEPSFGIGNWEIFFLGSDRVEDAVLYRENGTHDEIIEDAARIALHLKQWDKIWRTSFDEELSIATIKLRVDELLGKNPSGRET